jgi:hypothetical protein
MAVVLLLKGLVREVNAELLEGVLLERLETEDVENGDRTVFVGGGGQVVEGDGSVHPGDDDFEDVGEDGLDEGLEAATSEESRRNDGLL